MPGSKLLVHIVGELRPLRIPRGISVLWLTSPDIIRGIAVNLGMITEQPRGLAGRLPNRTRDGICGAVTVGSCVANDRELSTVDFRGYLNEPFTAGRLSCLSVRSCVMPSLDCFWAPLERGCEIQESSSSCAERVVNSWLQAP